MKGITVKLTADELAFTSIALDRYVHQNSSDIDASSDFIKLKEKWDDIYRSFWKLNDNGVREVNLEG